MSGYQICTTCILDTSDPDITFDADGRCSHCHAYREAMRESGMLDIQDRDRQCREMIERIRKAGVGREYDCVIGVSGGVDSTYVAYKVKELGLRPLAVHLDNGWDAELAVHNIQRTLDRLGIDLYTHVLDWEEFRDLQLAFLRASTPDSEIPTDHAIFSTLYETAWNRRIPYVIQGNNRVTEFALPVSWSQGHFDWHYIKAVHDQFGTRPLKTFPHLDAPRYLRHQWMSRNRSFNLLDYIDYSRAEAMDVLQNKLGWEYYGGKHYESIYTRFFQGYILPVKFGFDKRRAHLSNLIWAGEITRDDALREIEKDPYPSEEMKQQDRVFVLKKLGLSEAEFEKILATPPRRYEEFPSLFTSPMYLGARAISRKLAQLRTRIRSITL